MASTPMKAILYKGMQIFTKDYAENVEFVCLAANEDQRDWLTRSLSAFHKVPVVKSDIVRIATYPEPKNTQEPCVVCSGRGCPDCRR